MQTLSKSGCNLGACHGNARGKGGFQISLRGQNPEADYLVLTRDLYGRRVNLTNPDQSLILLKPTMQLAHEGGKRFGIDSLEFRILRDWISAGMPNDAPDAPHLTELHVTPDEVFLTKATESETQVSRATGWQLQIHVTARFSDGSSRDVTSLAVYEMAQPIAQVSHDGNVTGLSEGETTVLVRYLHLQIPVRIAFLPPSSNFVWSGPAPANFVDELVFAKLQKLRINPSPVCDDATFIRRVTLDMLGMLPTADETTRFISDVSYGKRAALIDALLERPEFSEWWAMKWSDLLRVEEKTLDRKGIENVYSWLRNSFATHVPLDQLIREIVSARGSTYEVPAANFYRALRTPFERSEAVGQLFLGVRLQCAKCHNHPFDRWTQDDYYSWGSVFAKVDYKVLENRRRDTNDKHEFDGEQIVFMNEDAVAKDPRTNKPRSAQLLGEAGMIQLPSDPLLNLAEWLTDSNNDRFVRMLANRMWQQALGRGIVDPIDDFRATNPASNQDLLQALANQLAYGSPIHEDHSELTNGSSHNSSNRIANAPVQATDQETNQFDLRGLLRVILNSKTYQLSSEPNETNREDVANFSHAIVRRHSAEQLLDATSQVLDIPLKFGGYPAGLRAVQVPGAGPLNNRGTPATEEDLFLRTFGRPPRLQSCDCERSDETTLNQTFQLVSGSLINRLLATKGNRLDDLLESGRSSDQIITELYWRALTRSPTSVELSKTSQFLEKTANRRAALEDICWALFNSNEFLLRR